MAQPEATKFEPGKDYLILLLGNSRRIRIHVFGVRQDKYGSSSSILVQYYRVTVRGTTYGRLPYSCPIEWIKSAEEAG